MTPGGVLSPTVHDSWTSQGTSGESPRLQPWQKRTRSCLSQRLDKDQQRKNGCTSRERRDDSMISRKAYICCKSGSLVYYTCHKNSSVILICVSGKKWYEADVPSHACLPTCVKRYEAGVSSHACLERKGTRKGRHSADSFVL